ncbi:hypothetical protein [Kribbella sp. DT2]|uniref:hypothetical protein n=1 Tax=Kribbella sp. DT2 TaxID=3393427 RepID=UPI003CF9D8A0
MTLPERPDAVSGIPRPPPGPVVVGPWGGCREAGRQVASWSPGREQQWFDIEEPILELAQVRRRHALWFAIAYPLLSGLGLAVAAGIWMAVREAGFDSSDAVAVAVIISVITILYAGVRFLQHRDQVVFAGAAWVGDGEGREACLPTYELQRIALVDPGTPKAALRITGANEAKLTIPMGVLEANPALWDLVHNGLRHSAAAGAEVDAAISWL